MTSIRGRLLTSLLIAAIAISTITGGVLFGLLRRNIYTQFDRTLKVRAQAIESLITIQDGRRLDIDFQPSAMSQFTGSAPSEYFEVRDSRMKLVVRSWLDSDLETLGVHQRGITTVQLPGSRAGRATQIQFTPAADLDDSQTNTEPSHDQGSITGHQKQPPAASDKTYFDTAGFAIHFPLTLTVARDAEPLSIIIRRAGALIAVAVALLFVSLIVSTMLIVRRELSRLDQLGSEANSIDFADANAHFGLLHAPAELQPIIFRLNDMLGRVRTAIERERRFGANIAHELRTPLAELRAAVEVAQMEPSDIALQYRAVSQAGEIAIQMQAIVTTLSRILKIEQNPTPVSLRPLLLQEAIRQASARYLSEADRRDLQLVLPTNLPRPVLAETVLLAAIVDNLLSNAFRYAPTGTTVSVGLNDDEDSSVTLTVTNTDSTLLDCDLPKLFEPFWRKDLARSEGEHVGLGLTLTRTFCAAMGATITAGRPSRDRIAFSVSFAAEPSTESLTTALVDRGEHDHDRPMLGTEEG